VSRVAGVACVVVASAVGVACNEPPSRTSCAQVVGGTWRVTAPAAHVGEEWAFVDHGRTVEGYALSHPGATALDDVRGTLPEGVVAAPISLSLERAGGTTLVGTATRRYMQGTRVCKVARMANLADCRGSIAGLTVVVPPVPSDFTTCATPEDSTTWTLTLQQAAATR